MHFLVLVLEILSLRHWYINVNRRGAKLARCCARLHSFRFVLKLFLQWLPKLDVLKTLYFLISVLYWYIMRKVLLIALKLWWDASSFSTKKVTTINNVLVCLQKLLGFVQWFLAGPFAWKIISFHESRRLDWAQFLVLLDITNALQLLKFFDPHSFRFRVYRLGWVQILLNLHVCFLIFEFNLDS